MCTTVKRDQQARTWDAHRLVLIYNFHRGIYLPPNGMESMENLCGHDDTELSHVGDGFVAAYMHDIKSNMEEKSEYKK